MNWQALTTTIVAGILALGFLGSVTALLISGVDVPNEFLPTTIMLAGAAVGAANKATG